MDSLQKKLENLCTDFLTFITYTKKFSIHSLKAYKNDLKDLLKYDSFARDQKNKLTTLHKRVSKKNLEQRIKDLIEQNINKSSQWANSSRSRKLAVIRSFIKWLAEKNYLEEDFRQLFKSPKSSYKIPSFLSVDEVFAILNTFQKKEKNIKPKEKALFFLIYGGGLRVSEACQLKNKDINWKDQVLKVTGKGSKQRLICLPKQAFEYLESLKNSQTYFFGSVALPQRKAYDMIRSIGKKTGLLKPLHPHALRHSFATHMLTGGSDLRVLQELLGHKSLTATQKYTHLDLAHLSNTLENYHPINDNS